MTNTCELLINIVIKNKPKTLTGLNQKVRGSVNPVLGWGYTDKTATGEEAGSNPSLLLR